MDINDLTIRQAKEIAAAFGAKPEQSGINYAIGKYVIIRTYSAGNWAGYLEQKAGNEVILKSARRMWLWHAKESISLSSVAIHGIKPESKIVAPVDSVWLEAIEIIPCTEVAKSSIEGAANVKAQ